MAVVRIEVDGDLSVVQGHMIAHAVKDVLLKSDLRIKDVLVRNSFDWIGRQVEATVCCTCHEE